MVDTAHDMPVFLLIQRIRRIQQIYQLNINIGKFRQIFLGDDPQLTEHFHHHSIAGLAIAAVTQLLYRYKDRPASWLFVAGTLLGGAYEYLCSVFTEVVFGTVFWDYSAIPFNLGGRINLLYCFFWGFAAIAWFKVLYPPISHMIESLPKRFGTVLTWGLCVFMAANIAVSSAALVRYNERVRGEAAATSLAACLDEHFDDARMAKVYPKAVHVESGGESLA